MLAYVISFSQIDITSGLVAYYPFNGNAKDSTTNANHGNMIGVTLANDRDGNTNSAYFFDGNDHYIDVPSASSIEPQNKITVSAWVNTTDKTYWNYVLCKRLNISSSPYASYCLAASSPGPSPTWMWNVSSSTTQYDLVSTTPIEDSAWIHLVGTFDGDTMKIFQNGIEIASMAASFTIGYSNLSLRLGLGILTSSGSKQAWKGYLDEVRIYDRVLTEAEITYLYNPLLLSVNNLLPAKIAINLYPNPAKNTLFLSTATAKDVLDRSEIIITDLSGREVIWTAYNEQGIDVSELSQGIYFVHIPAFGSALRFIKE